MLFNRLNRLFALLSLAGYLLIAPGSLLAETQTYVIILKNGLGASEATGSFQWDPVQSNNGSGGSTVSFTVTGTTKTTWKWDIIATVTSVPQHVDQPCPSGQPCPSRVRIVQGSGEGQTGSPIAWTTLTLDDDGDDGNRLGTWEISDTTNSNDVLDSGGTFLRNATEIASSVPTPPTGLLLLAGFIPLLVLKFQKNKIKS